MLLLDHPGGVTEQGWIMGQFELNAVRVETLTDSPLAFTAPSCIVEGNLLARGGSWKSDSLLFCDADSH